MRRNSFYFLVLALMTVTSVAAQLEVNDAGGSMTSQGRTPVSGAPFCVPINETMDFEIEGGIPTSAYLLAFGPFQDPGFTFAQINETSNLNLQTSEIIGDGIGMAPGLLPSTFFVLNNGAQAVWALPSNVNLAGQNIAFQAVTTDPTIMPGGINITAAVEFQIPTVPMGTNLLDEPSFFGNRDDGAAVYTFQGGPYSFYGQSYTGISVSTNGWIAFGATAVNSDVTETDFEFINGAVGLPGGAGRPCIAALWDDLAMDNDVCNQQLLVNENVLTGTVTVTWRNVDYFPSQVIGDIVCCIDFTQGRVEFDYQGYNAVPSPQNGIVGISDGNVAQSTGNPGGPDTEMDLFIGASVNGVNPGMGNFSTIFQNFGGAMLAQPFDGAGRTITFSDPSGLGNWTVF